jgi:hypothetical protein
MNDNDALGDSLRAMRQEGASIEEAAQRTGADPADVELVAGLGSLRGATAAGADAGLYRARFLDSIGEEKKMGFIAAIFSSPLRTIAAAGVAAAIVGGIIGGTNPGGVNETLGVSSDDDNGAIVTPTSTPDATVTPDVTVTPQATPDDDDDDDDDGRNRGPGGGDDDDDDGDDNSGPGSGEDDDGDDNSNSGPGSGDDDADDDDSSGPGSGGDDDDDDDNSPGGGDDDD